jgi:hypothetical protein
MMGYGRQKSAPGRGAGERRFRREGWRANLGGSGWRVKLLLLNSCFSKPMVYVFSFTSGLTVLLDL